MGWASIRKALLLLLLCVAPAAGAKAAETRALVIAASYVHAANPDLALANTLTDGRTVAAALRRAGLADVALVEEPDAAAWEAALAAFLDRLRPDDLALVYYAGHGLQVSGRNYFVAADGETLIDVERMMPRLTARARGTILIVDACRNNPFRRGSGSDTLAVEGGTGAAGESRSMTISVAQLAAAQNGLSQLGDLRGLSALAFFSTEPGNVAEDGDPGAGSPFANAVAAELRRRQSLDAAFRRIAVAVNRATGGRQSPWRQGDLPFDVYIAGMQSFPVP